MFIKNLMKKSFLIFAVSYSIFFAKHRAFRLSVLSVFRVAFQISAFDTNRKPKKPGFPSKPKSQNSNHQHWSHPQVINFHSLPWLPFPPSPVLAAAVGEPPPYQTTFHHHLLTFKTLQSKSHHQSPQGISTQT